MEKSSTEDFCNAMDSEISIDSSNLETVLKVTPSSRNGEVKEFMLSGKKPCPVHVYRISLIHFHQPHIQIKTYREPSFEGLRDG